MRLNKKQPQAFFVEQISHRKGQATLPGRNATKFQRGKVMGPMVSKACFSAGEFPLHGLTGKSSMNRAWSAPFGQNNFNIIINSSIH